MKMMKGVSTHSTYPKKGRLWFFFLLEVLKKRNKPFLCDEKLMKKYRFYKKKLSLTLEKV